MNVVDSSAWLEYFADGPNAAFFAPAIEDPRRLVVPSICLVEVFRRLMQQVGVEAALRATAAMQSGEVVALDAALSRDAGRVGVERRLALADSIVLATALSRDAFLWTQDADFEGYPKLRFRAKA
ncbi:MAG: type II toxin-antitoxin system VapC family toxin [Vicinamibacteria bacterium]|nr:type II toxin-antitoxin system VapC family toxin [Vicinamibacteria bacterium]